MLILNIFDKIRFVFCKWILALKYSPPRKMSKNRLLGVKFFQSNLLLCVFILVFYIYFNSIFMVNLFFSEFWTSLSHQLFINSKYTKMEFHILWHGNSLASNICVSTADCGLKCRKKNMDNIIGWLQKSRDEKRFACSFNMSAEFEYIFQCKTIFIHS